MILCKKRFQTSISYTFEKTQSYNSNKNYFFYLIEIISL